MRISAGIILLGSLCWTACGDPEPEPEPEPSNMIVVGNLGEKIVPNQVGIQEFVSGGGHKSWQRLQTQMQSLPPHTEVIIYYNDNYLNARKQSSYPMPIGAMAVVEENYSGGTTTEGYSASLKATTGTTAQSWLWWQAATTYITTARAFGIGVEDCMMCHKTAEATNFSLSEMLP